MVELAWREESKMNQTCISDGTGQAEQQSRAASKRLDKYGALSCSKIHERCRQNPIQRRVDSQSHCDSDPPLLEVL